MSKETVIGKIIYIIGIIAVVFGFIGCPIALYIGNPTLGLITICICGALIFIYTMLIAISARWWINHD